MTVWTVPARIVRVVDGDSIHLNLDLGWKIWFVDEPCRLARINAPEVSTQEGRDARDFLAGLLAPVIAAGTVATFTSKSLDKYGRALGELTVPSIGNINEIMLTTGHAVPYAS